MSYLKQKTVHIESLGEDLLIRELPSAAQLQMIEHKDSPFEGIFIACKFGVVDWAEKSLDEIKEMISMRQANEVSSAVFDISGVDVKKSDSAPNEDSSSD